MHTSRSPRAACAICIHGAGGGGWEWTIWQRVLTARGWSVLAPDLVPAQTGIAATRFEEYAMQVRGWGSACDAPCVLIGASLGGLLALHAAADLRPAALLLINPLPPAGIMPRPARTEYPDVVPWGRERSLAGTQRALPDADAAACLQAWRRWRDESGAVMRAAAQGIAVAPHACPALVFASAGDSDIDAAAARALALRIDADFRLLAGASHVGALLGRGASAVAADAAEWCERALQGTVYKQTDANPA